MLQSSGLIQGDSSPFLSPSDSESFEEIQAAGAFVSRTAERVQRTEFTKKRLVTQLVSDALEDYEAHRASPTIGSAIAISARSRDGSTWSCEWVRREVLGPRSQWTSRFLSNHVSLQGLPHISKLLTRKEAIAWGATVLGKEGEAARRRTLAINCLGWTLGALLASAAGLVSNADSAVLLVAGGILALAAGIAGNLLASRLESRWAQVLPERLSPLLEVDDVCAARARAWIVERVLNGARKTVLLVDGWETLDEFSRETVLAALANVPPRQSLVVVAFQDHELEQFSRSWMTDSRLRHSRENRLREYQLLEVSEEERLKLGSFLKLDSSISLRLSRVGDFSSRLSEDPQFAGRTLLRRLLEQTHNQKVCVCSDLLRILAFGSRYGLASWSAEELLSELCGPGVFGAVGALKHPLAQRRLARVCLGRVLDELPDFFSAGPRVGEGLRLQTGPSLLIMDTVPTPEQIFLMEAFSLYRGRRILSRDSSPRAVVGISDCLVDLFLLRDSAWRPDRASDNELLELGARSLDRLVEFCAFAAAGRLCEALSAWLLRSEDSGIKDDNVACRRLREIAAASWNLFVVSRQTTASSLLGACLHALAKKEDAGESKRDQSDLESLFILQGVPEFAARQVANLEEGPVDEVAPSLRRVGALLCLESCQLARRLSSAFSVMRKQAQLQIQSALDLSTAEGVAALAGEYNSDESVYGAGLRAEIFGLGVEELLRRGESDIEGAGLAYLEVMGENAIRGAETHSGTLIARAFQVDIGARTLATCIRMATRSAGDSTEVDWSSVRSVGEFRWRRSVTWGAPPRDLLEVAKEVRRSLGYAESGNPDYASAFVLAEKLFLDAALIWEKLGSARLRDRCLLRRAELLEEYSDFSAQHQRDHEVMRDLAAISGSDGVELETTLFAAAFYRNAVDEAWPHFLRAGNIILERGAASRLSIPIATEIVSYATRASLPGAQRLAHLIADVLFGELRAQASSSRFQPKELDALVHFVLDSAALIKVDQALRMKAETLVEALDGETWASNEWQDSRSAAAILEAISEARAAGRFRIESCSAIVGARVGECTLSVARVAELALGDGLVVDRDGYNDLLEFVTRYGPERIGGAGAMLALGIDKASHSMGVAAWCGPAIDFLARLEETVEYRRSIAQEVEIYTVLDEHRGHSDPRWRERQIEAVVRQLSSMQIERALARWGARRATMLALSYVKHLRRYVGPVGQVTGFDDVDVMEPGELVSKAWDARSSVCRLLVFEGDRSLINETFFRVARNLEEIRSSSGVELFGRVSELDTAMNEAAERELPAVLRFLASETAVPKLVREIISEHEQILQSYNRGASRN